MNYYLDCEFNGFGGALITLALVREDDQSLYLHYIEEQKPVKWVAENVMPIIHSTPLPVNPVKCGPINGAQLIARFLRGDAAPHINVDWPDDIAYFCKAIMTGPGEMIAIPHLSFELHRVDAYPTDLPGAVQHNAWWDAMALRRALEK